MEMETDKKEEKEHAIEHAGLDNGRSLQSEVDLSERDESSEEHHEEEHHTDYSNFSKEQFVGAIKELTREDNFKKIDNVLREIKPLFDDIREREKSEALARFIGEGGVEQDFEFKGDEFDHTFDATFKSLRDKKTQYFKQQEESKVNNLKKKQDLLEKLRVLFDAHDNADQFEQFKSLQKEWKAIGSVPGPQAKTLWANYHALTDRFYDNQSIYFELKELDRRKNLEAKVELCARAEKLVAHESIKDAIAELNELHHEFKHLGPVPKDDKEAVWQRFKAASDALYARRDAYLETLQKELHVNFGNKATLSDQVQEFVNFQSDRIKDWNQRRRKFLTCRSVGIIAGCHGRKQRMLIRNSGRVQDFL